MTKNFVKIGNCKGVTLLEILVALSIFSIVVTGAINLFASLIKYQKNLIDRAYVLSTLSYSVEYMSKAIRMAQKDMTGSCVGVAGKNFLKSGSSIKFLNYHNGPQECQEFFLEGGAVKVRKIWTGQTLDESQPQALTPANIVVEGLSFFMAGENQNDTLQPRVSFSLKAKALNSKEPSLIIQTTVSQRMLDVFY